jgi:hypothetical protein
MRYLRTKLKNNLTHAVIFETCIQKLSVRISNQTQNIQTETFIHLLLTLQASDGIVSNDATMLQ